MMKKYLLFLFLLPILTFGQTTQTFSTAGTSSFVVPNGVTSLDVQAWGGGGCSGHNTSATSGSCGGGGGGAYTGGTISVSSGATFSYTVGAGGIYNTAGTTPPVAGSPSTFSVITANGGSRGGRSTVSNGGAGGTVSPDPGGVTSFISRAGGTGGNGGNNVSFSGGGGGGAAGSTAAGTNGAISALNTGGAGGAGGATGGGAGGNASNFSPSSSGVYGTAPGGGGGGRAYNNTGSNTNGGRGEIRVTYTCISYDVLTAAAAASQFSSGAPSTVTLTSSSLSVGTYTVTYSTTNPVTSGNTATMTFSGTTGTFLTMALTADSDITVTSLKSGSGVGCSSTITTNNTATAVLDSVVVTAGAVATEQTICSGNTPAALTSSSDGTTSSGTLSYEWQTNASGSYVTIPSENGGTYSPPALTATTSYQRRTLALNGGNTTYSGYTTPVTITANTAASGAIGITTSTICNGTTAAITSSTAGTGSGTITYEWQTNATGSYVTIPSEIAATYTTPALTTTTSYQRRTVSTLNGVACYSAYTSPLTITVSATVTAGSIGSAQTYCAGSSVIPAPFTSLTAGTGSGTITYEWSENSSGSYVVIAGATAASYTPTTPITVTTTYRRRTVSTFNTRVCNSSYVTAVVTFNVLTEGTIGNGQTICNEANLSVSNTLDGTATTGNSTRSYEWQADNGSGYVTLSGVVTSSCPTGALTTTTSYRRRTVSLSNGTTCYSNYTAPVTIIVQDLVTIGAIGPVQTILPGETPAPLTSLTDGTGSGTITYEWQTNASGTFTGGGTIATTSGYAPPALTVNTGYRRRTISVQNGVTCTSAFSQISVMVNNATAGTIGTDQTICNGDTPATLTSVLAGVPTNGLAVISYEWQDNSSGSYLTVPGAISDTYSPPALSATTSYQRRTVSAFNGTTFYSAYTTPITITVNPAVTAGTIGTAQTICNGGIPTSISSSADGTGSGTISYEWQDNSGGSYATISGANASTYSPLALTATTSYQRRTVSLFNGINCYSAYTSPVTITVSDVVTAGTIGTAQTICNGDTPSTLTSTTAGTGSGTISYEWQTNASGSFITIASATSDTYSPPSLTATTSYQRRTVSTFNGTTCYSTYTSPITITINNVTQGSIATAQTICSTNTPAALTSTTSGTGSGTISYEWQTNASGSFVTIPSATSDTYSPPSLTTTTSYQRRTVSLFNGTTCYSTYTSPVTITVNNVTEGIIGTSQIILSGTAPAVLTSLTDGTGSGTVSYQWQTLTFTGSFYTDIAGAFGATYAPPTLTVGRFYRRRTVSILPGRTCYSNYSNSITISVNDVTAGAIGTNQTICNGSTPAALTSTADGTGFSPLSYEWQTNASGSFATISGANAATYAPPALTATTTYQRRTVSMAVGTTLYSPYTTAVTITVNNAVTAGAIGTAQTICNGTAPPALTSTTAGTGSGTISYEWQTNASGSFVTIPSATSDTYSPPSLTATTSYQRRTVSVSGGTTCYSSYTTPIVITVGAAVTAGVIGTAQTICNANTPATLTSSSAGTGSGTVSYEWQDNSSGSYVTISGATSATFSPPALTASTSYQRRTVSLFNGTTCYSAYTTPVTINVNNVAEGIIGTSQTILSGTAPASLTSQTDGTGSGTVSYEWQTRTLPGTYTDIPGAFGATYAPPTLTATTNYRRRTVSILNGITCNSSYANIITITVNDVTAGAIGTNQTICNGTIPATLTSTTAGTGLGALTYEWQTNASGSFVTISGATSATYAPPALTSTTSFQRRTVSVSGGTTLYSPYTASVTITVNNAVTAGSIETAQTICNGTAPATLTSTTAGTGSGIISYEWQTNASGSFVTIPSATSDSYSPPSLTATTSYQRRTVSVSGGTTCYSSYTTPIVITVGAAVTAGSIGNTKTICNGTAPGTITNSGAGAGSGTITYEWQDNSSGSYVTISGATTLTYVPPTLTATTSYQRRTVSVFNGTTCYSIYTTPVTITVSNVVTEGTIGTSQTICTGTAPATLTSIADGSGSGTIAYQWQTRTLPAGYMDIVGATAATYSPPTLTATTNYRRLAISTLNGVSCNSASYSNVATVTVTANLSPVAITPTAAQTFCQVSDGTQLSVGTPTDGGSFTRLWGKRSVSGGAITNLSADGSTFTPTSNNVGVGTWLVVCTVTPTCGSPMVSNEVSVTINPTPTLTGASQATPVCNGSGATINLTGLVAGSTSTVTYTINGGSTVTLTGLVADGSGAASFTTAALTTANNGQVLQITGITITSATPNCNFIPTNRNVTLVVNSILSAVAITPATAQTICFTASGSVLTVAETGGGVITRQWGKRASTGGVITDIVGQTGTTYTPTGASLGAGSWFVVCTSTPTCGSPIISNEVSVVVSTPLTLTGASQAASICSGSAAVINLTGLTPSTTSTITYQIAGGTTRTVTGVVADASGNASFTTITTLTGTNNGQTLQITGITVPSASPVCTTVFAQNLTLSVIAPTIGTYSQSTAVCAGSSATILLTGMLPNTTSTISYQLAGSIQPDITGLVSDASGNASFSIVANNSQNFRILSITVTSTTPNCTTAIGSSGAFNLSVPTIAAGSIGTSQTVCSGSSPTITSLVDGTGTGIITYEWQADNGTGYVTISGASDSTYAPPALTTTTSYRRRTLATFSGQTCYSAYTTAITMTVNTLTAGAIGGSTTICSENSRNIFQLTAGTASTGSSTRSYEWQANDGTGWVTIPGEIDTSYQTPILTITTSYRRRTVAVSNGVTCYSDYTTPVTISVNSVNAGIIGTKQSICAGDTPAPLTSITDGTGAGTITYEWGVRVGIPGAPLFPTFTTIPGATGATYSPGVTTIQTSYRRRVISTLNGVTCFSPYVAVTIRVGEPEEGVIGSDQTICAGTVPATLTSIEAGAAPGTITYEWQANEGAGYVTIPGATAATYSPPVLTTTTSYQRRTLGVCAGLPTASIWTNAVTVTVNVVTAGTIGTNQNYCAATTPATLTSTIAGTGPGTITYEWQTNASGSYVTISGATAETYSPPALTATTSYQRRTISTLNGLTCSSVYTSPITITFNSTPATPTISGTTNATCLPFTGTVTLAGLPATGTWTINPGGISGTGTSYTITGLSSGNYTYTVTNSNGCISNATNTATVAPVVTNTWNGTTWSNGTTSNQQALIFNSNYPPVIDPNVDLYGCSCTVTTGNNVTIKAGRNLILTDQVSVVGTGTLTFENTASLIQINNVTNSGNVSYKRSTTPINKFDYSYWSTPVLPFTLGGISANTKGDKFYSFDPSVNNWKQESSATSMVAGTGYIIRGPESFDNSSRTVYEATFNGVPINGNINISGVVPDASYLLGNPYPSALDADSFLNANQNVLDGTLYFWTHNTPIAANTPNPGSGALAYSGDDYATYNQTGGTAAGPGNTPSGKIASGQGFFGGTKTVAAGFVSSTPIVYTNAMRVGVGGITGDNTQFFKTKEPAAKATTVVEKHRVWLNLTNEQGAFKQTLVGYITGATNEYENRFDGKSFDGNEFLDFYSLLRDKNLSIQGRGLPFDENDEIPLGYRVAVAGTFSIAIDQKDGILSNQSVFIEDKLTNTVHKLNTGKYTFTTAKGIFDNRFVLKYNNKTLNVKELELSKGIAVSFSNSNRTLLIRNNLKEATITSATLFNIAGQKIAHWDVKGREQTNIQIPIRIMPSALYIVKIKTSKGDLSKKIIIK